MTEGELVAPNNRTATDIFADELFAGRTALVTGGGRGIGAAIAASFARFGASVVIAGRTAETLELTAKEINEAGGACLPVVADIRDVEQVEALRDAALKRFSCVDYVINNAGGQFLSRPSEITDRGWRSVLDLNLNGTWNMCSRFMPGLAEQGSGSIVNIVHPWVFDRGAPMFPHSGAARAGVVSLTRSLAPYLEKRHVTINAVAPGVIDTAGRQANYAIDLGSDEARAMAGDLRFGTPADIAAIVLFLCSPGAYFINGAVLVADAAGTQLNFPMIDDMVKEL